MMGRELPWYVEELGSNGASKQNLSIDYIKRTVGIRTLLAHYGATLPKDRSSVWQSIPCPFHADKHPSASFNDKFGQFNCFVCDIKGDVIDVVQQHEGLTIKESLTWISQTLL